ncbi:helix-turn-helix transcriptional regulator [Tardiphaga sp. 215_C5_N2_1]|uniref:helix-turn-helix transcriptional regulator n=1 Tax=Tardiphaga sp. 215_C5_N2_1 TaxID=3240774 RepID=UPI003F8BDE6B
MHRIYQTFVDRLTESTSAAELKNGMAETARALDLSCFAYLRISRRKGDTPLLISTYPSTWTEHYLKNHYERFDPVITQALEVAEPFQWGLNSTVRKLSRPQQELFEDAARFGIACGFTIPIHDGRGPIAAVTFAADKHLSAAFSRRIEAHGQVLQLMAMYFHAHVRCKFPSERVINGIILSPREFECLGWAAQGKSAWEIGRILGITRRTTAFHLENAKAKLGVHSISHAVALLVAFRQIMP